MCKTTFVMPLETDTSGSGEDSSEDNVPCACIAQRYRHEHENSESEGHIPKMELAKHSRRQKKWCEDDSDSGSASSSSSRLFDEQNMNATHNYIIDGLSEDRLLLRHEKRSLLPIIGEAAIWLFGLVTDADLTNIRKNIKNLAKNQRDIMQVIQESISILNMSQIEIAENRQAVADLLVSVTALDKMLEHLIDDIRKQIQETKYFLEMYLKLNLITLEIKDMIRKAMLYLEHLKT